nr:odorant binding protein 5 [Trissolcus basalis]
MRTLVGLSLLLIISLHISGTHCKMSIKDLTQMVERVGQAKCLKKSGAQLAQVVAARKGEFDDDYNLKCYYKCILEKMKMLKGDQFQIENTKKQVRAMMEESLQEPLINSGLKCYEARTQTEPCELSFEAVKCYYNSSPSYFFF